MCVWLCHVDGRFCCRPSAGWLVSTLSPVQAGVTFRIVTIPSFYSCITASMFAKAPAGATILGDPTPGRMDGLLDLSLFLSFWKDTK